MKKNEMIKALKKSLMTLVLAATMIAGVGAMGCDQPGQLGEAVAQVLGGNARRISFIEKTGAFSRVTPRLDTSLAH